MEANILEYKIERVVHIFLLYTRKFMWDIYDEF